jgi:aminoglycoside phosphotransferase (APT) family kinase protein
MNAVSRAASVASVAFLPADSDLSDDMVRMIVYATVSRDTREVRSSEQRDWAALASYLRGHLAFATSTTGRDAAGGDAPGDAIDVSQFPGGHSNLTYLARFGSVELVVRCPPLGPLAPKAHDMAREYRWLAALHPVFPLAPEPYLLCEDPSVIGSTFYVMERRRGVVVRHEEPPALAGSRGARRGVSQALVDTLADLHAIDVGSGPIAELGKPAGFVRRQVRGWSDRWQRSKVSDLPEMDAVAAWLAARIPDDPARPAIVHGDFKLDNVMLDSLDVGRIVAVFDWEMGALGDPLVDLGIFLAYWATGPAAANQAAAPGERDALSSVTDRPGWWRRDEILERYALRSGRSLSSLRFYEVFALFKIAVVVQQIHFRYVAGQTDDPRFATFGGRVTRLARQAAAIAGD